MATKTYYGVVEGWEGDWHVKSVEAPNINQARFALDVVNKKVFSVHATYMQASIRLDKMVKEVMR